MLIQIQRKNSKSQNVSYPTGIIITVLMIAIIFFSAVPVQAESIIAICGGTVLTMTGQTIRNGTVLIRGEKIEAVGADVKIPKGANIINATGKYVLPGIIDAMTYYGIKAFDLNDFTNPITPQNRIIQAFYPFGDDFFRGKGGIKPDKEILCGGVTTIYIAPGNRQVIGGQGAVVKTYGKNFDSMILCEPASIDMAIGDSPKTRQSVKFPYVSSSASQAERSILVSSPTRMAQAALIRKALIRAQEFDHSLQAYEKKSEAERKEVQKPKRDLNMEALVKLLHKEIPARIEASLVDDIRTAIRIADEFDFDLIIDSGIGAYKLRDLLAEKNIPVVLGPTSHPFIKGGEASRTSELSQIMDEGNAAMLSEVGVKIAIASFASGGLFGDAVQGKWLLLEAGLATGFGLPDEEALKAVTINAAEILGVNDRVGSLEPGKDADVIILDGPPLSIKTWVEHVFINGELVYTREKSK
jgi:imidazolonepropionase-like amidohydrolase